MKQEQRNPDVEVDVATLELAEAAEAAPAEPAGLQDQLQQLQNQLQQAQAKAEENWNHYLSARAEADTLLRGSRTHLYGLLLKARAADASGDAATARAAMQAFVANYDAERAKNLPEYAEHNQLLIETRNQAVRGPGAARR